MVCPDNGIDVKIHAQGPEGAHGFIFQSVNFGGRKNAFGKIPGGRITQAHSQVHVKIGAVEILSLRVGIAFDALPGSSDHRH